MAPQSWVSIFNILSFFGAFLIVISSVGTWYFGSKVDDEKDKKISELIEGKNALFQQSNTVNAEATEIKRLNNLMLRAMESAGQVKLQRDSEGKIIGFIIELTSSAKAGASASAELTKESKELASNNK